MVRLPPPPQKKTRTDLKCEASQPTLKDGGFFREWTGQLCNRNRYRPMECRPEKEGGRGQQYCLLQRARNRCHEYQKHHFIYKKKKKKKKKKKTLPAYILTNTRSLQECTLGKSTVILVWLIDLRGQRGGGGAKTACIKHETVSLCTCIKVGGRKGQHKTCWFIKKKVHNKMGENIK